LKQSIDHLIGSRACSNEVELGRDRQRVQSSGAGRIVTGSKKKPGIKRCRTVLDVLERGDEKTGNRRCGFK
jgi:hypothetical protein